MYSISGKGIVLKIDQPFELDGVKYSSGWLRHSSEEERREIGIVETPDPEVYDTRFYTSYGEALPLEDLEITRQSTIVDENNNEIGTEENTITSPGLRTFWLNSNKINLNSFLKETDWYIVRKYERDVDVPAEVEAYRAAVHAEGARLEEAILAATTVEELKEVVTNQNWPSL